MYKIEINNPKKKLLTAIVLLDGLNFCFGTIEVTVQETNLNLF